MLTEVGSADASKLVVETTAPEMSAVEDKEVSKFEVVEVSCFVRARENVCVQVQSERAVAVDVVMTVTTCPVTL